MAGTPGCACLCVLSWSTLCLPCSMTRIIPPRHRHLPHPARFPRLEVAHDWRQVSCARWRDKPGVPVGCPCACEARPAARREQMTSPAHAPSGQRLLEDDQTTIAGQRQPSTTPAPPSIASWRSLLSGYSALSVGSLFSFASVFSIGSAGSVLSIGSSGSILSIGSAGSILRIGSAGGILAIGRRGGSGRLGRRRGQRARRTALRLVRGVARIPVGVAMRRARQRWISQ